MKTEPSTQGDVLCALVIQQIISANGGSSDALLEAVSSIDWVQCSAHVYSLGHTLVTPKDLKRIFFNRLSLFRTTKVAGGPLAALQISLRPTFEALDRWEQASPESPVADALSNLSLDNVVSKELLLQVVERCEKLKGADWFRDLVNPYTMMVHDGHELGPWSKVIKHSIGTTMVKQMIQRGEIETISQLKVSLLRIGANSVMFNAPQGDYPPAARDFVKQCLQVLDQVTGGASSAPPLPWHSVKEEEGAPPAKKGRR